MVHGSDREPCFPPPQYLSIPVDHVAIRPTCPSCGDRSVAFLHSLLHLRPLLLRQGPRLDQTAPHTREDYGPQGVDPRGQPEHLPPACKGVVLDEVARDDGSHDPWEGTEGVGDPQQHTCVPGDRTNESSAVQKFVQKRRDV